MKKIFKPKFFLTFLCTVIIVSSLLISPVHADTITNGSQAYKIPTTPGIVLSINDWKTLEVGTYPINSKSAQWTTLSYIDALTLCNMPLQLVQSLSTQDLAKYALNYPLLTDILGYESIDDGLEHLKKSSTLFAELFNRPDCSSVFLEYYSALSCDYTTLLVYKNMIDSNYFKLYFLESYFGNQFMDLSPQVKKTFIKKFEQKYLEKPTSVRAYSSTTIFYDALSETVDIIPSEAIPTAIKADMINNKDVNGPSFTITILDLRQNPANLAYVYYGYELINGKRTYGYLYSSGDFTADEKESRDAAYDREHPSYDRLRSCTKKYNCHSYAWYSTFANNTFWMLDPTTLANDSNYYTEWTSTTGNPSAGSKIIFYDADGHPIHSAILNADTSKCTSKQGSAGVYITTVAEMTALYDATSYKIYVPN